MTSILTSAFRVYFFAIVTAVRLLVAGFFLEGIKLLLSPVGYWRFLPNAYVP